MLTLLRVLFEDPIFTVARWAVDWTPPVGVRAIVSVERDGEQVVVTLKRACCAEQVVFDLDASRGQVEEALDLAAEGLMRGCRTAHIPASRKIDCGGGA